MTYANPLVGIPLLGLGMAAQSPVNLGRTIGATQKLFEGRSLPPGMSSEALRDLVALSSRNNKK